MGKRVVVIFDDELSLLGMYGKLFARSAAFAAQFELQTFATTQYGLEFIRTHRDQVAAIAMDGRMPGSTDPPHQAVIAIRQLGFKGPMIANSSEPELQQKLMEAGCSIECPEKRRLPETMLEALGAA